MHCAVVCNSCRGDKHKCRCEAQSAAVQRKLSANTFTWELSKLSANSWSTVGRLSIDCWSSVDRLLVVCRLIVGRLSANCWPFVGWLLSVGWLLVVCRPTVGRLSADCWLSVGRLSADCWSFVGWLSANRFFGRAISQLYPIFCLRKNKPTTPEGSLGGVIDKFLKRSQTLIYTVHVYLDDLNWRT